MPDSPPPPPAPPKDLVRLVADEAVAFSAPLLAAVDPWGRARLLTALGWDLAALSGYDPVQLEAWLASLEASAAAVAAIVLDPGDLDFARLKRIIDEGGKASKAFTSLPPVLTGQLPAGLSAETMGIDLLTFLTVNRLHRASPVVYRSAVLLGLVTPAADNPVSLPVPADDNRPPVRLPRRRDTLHLDRVVDLLVDPVGLLAGLYAPGGITDQASADRTASLLLPRVAAVMGELGVPARYGVESDLATRLSPAGVTLSGHMLSLQAQLTAGALRSVGATLALRHQPAGPGTRGGAGLVVVPSLGLDFSTVLGGWRLDLEISGTPPAAFEISGDGITASAGAGSFTALGRASRVPDAEGHAFRLGPADGTHLALGQIGVEGFVTLGAGRDDVGITLLGGKGEIVLRPGDGDAFLKRLLPADGMRAAFDLGLGWSRRGGLVLAGGASTAVTMPVHVPLGPFALESVYLAVEGELARRVVLATAAVTVRAEIGAFKAVVERIGITAEVSFPDSGGALGPVATALRFKQPDGIGITIGAGPVTGGGYLFIDERKGQYAGALEIGFGDFKLAALGLLNTKLPDGSPIRDADGDAWSLLVVAAAQWKPVHLAFGIHLAGAGIVVGIHRTVDLKALREGVRTKALDAVLFPPDPVGNAPQLLATLGSLFPVAVGRHTFGLMGRFTWGPGTWLSLDLALLLELPRPLRLIALGRVQLVLPRPPDAKTKVAKPTLQLRLDSVGILDFDRAEFSLDATFVDSTIAGMAVTGDMAIRASWGERKRFALSAGGFHPRFRPPPGFPEVRRLTLAISAKANPKITLQAYLAVTSNTVQLGARLDLHAEAAGFSVDGHLLFDVLVRFSPFGFEIDLEASVVLKRGSRVLMSVLLKLHLAGPEPWHARGKATFSLWFIKGSVPVEAKVGAPREPLPAPRAADPIGRLLAELSDPGAWSVRPPSSSSIATLRGGDAVAGALLVHPLGAVGVQQSLLPLGVSVQRLGTAALDRPRRYDITGVRYGTSTVTVPGTPIHDAFAPGEFFDLTDDQRLSRPDFEELRAGVAFGTSGDAAPTDLGVTAFAAVTYEVGILDAPERPLRAPRAGGGAGEVSRGASEAADGEVAAVGDVTEAVTPQELARMVATGPVAVAPGRRAGPARFAAPALQLGVQATAYVLVDDAGTVLGQEAATCTEALEGLVAAGRDLSAATLVPSAEVVA